MLDRVREIEEKLEPYVELEGSEIGEAARALMQASHYSYCMSKDCFSAIVAELETQLEMFETQCEIVETTKTYTRTSRELVWN